VLQSQQEQQLQVLAAIKSLRDDPLRLVRALRFSACLHFRVHASFWRAAPFAVDALRTKVSGERKAAELRKIAKAGTAPLLDFFEAAFLPLPFFGEKVPLGDALFGGRYQLSDAGVREVPKRISVTVGFNGDAMRRIVATLPPGLGADARLGAVMSAAFISCDLRQCGPCGESSSSSTSPFDVTSPLEEACLLAGPPIEYSVDEGQCGTGDLTLEAAEAADERMGAAIAVSLREVERACEGLCASQSMLQTATLPLAAAQSLLQLPLPQGQHALFAAAALSDAHADRSLYVLSAAEFASLVRTWELLKLDPVHAKRRLQVGIEFVIAMLRTRCDPRTSERIGRRVDILSAAGPIVNGRAVAGLEGVPTHLRGCFISQLHVLCRLRGETPTLETAEQLATYLAGPCGGLLDRLRSEWWETSIDGKPSVKPLYSKEAMNAWLHGG